MKRNLYIAGGFTLGMALSPHLHGSGATPIQRYDHEPYGRR